MTADTLPGVPSGVAPELPRAILFEEGLVGCPTWRHFVLEPDAAGPAIQLLRCLDVEGVALYVADPFTIVPDYEFEIADADAEALELSDPRDALVLVVLTVHTQPPAVTANLLGPLVVNVRTGRGRQLVLGSSDYSVRHVVHG